MHPAALPRRRRSTAPGRPRCPTPSCAPVRRFVRAHRRATSTPAAGCGSSATSGTGKTTLAMLVSKAALEAGRSVRDLLAAAPARRDPRDLSTTSATAPTSTCSTAWPRSTCCTSTTSAPRRPARLGARAALRDRQRPLRGRALDRHHHEPRARRSSPSRSASARCRGSSEMCDDPLPLFGARPPARRTARQR